MDEIDLAYLTKINEWNNAYPEYKFTYSITIIYGKIQVLDLDDWRDFLERREIIVSYIRKYWYNKSVFIFEINSLTESTFSKWKKLSLCLRTLFTLTSNDKGVIYEKIPFSNILATDTNLYKLYSLT